MDASVILTTPELIGTLKQEVTMNFWAVADMPAKAQDIVLPTPRLPLGHSPSRLRKRLERGVVGWIEVEHASQRRPFGEAEQRDELVVVPRPCQSRSRTRTDSARC